MEAVWQEEDRAAAIEEQRIMREYSGAQLGVKSDIKDQRIMELARRKVEQVRSHSTFGHSFCLIRSLI